MKKERTNKDRRDCRIHRYGKLLMGVLAVCSWAWIGVDANRCVGSSHPYRDCVGWGRTIVDDDGSDDGRYRRGHPNRCFPRNYDYHRRGYGVRRNWNTVTRQDCSTTGACVTDLTRDILSIPLYMVNSLLRQNLNQKMQRSHPTSHTKRDTRKDRTQHVTPGYAVEDRGSHLELTLEIPGVDSRDLEVELIQEGGTAVLHVRGTRLFRRFGSVVKSTFTHAFQIEMDDIDVDAIEVKLSSGILIVIAPKKESRIQPRKRRLDIAIEGDDRDHGPFDSISGEKATIAEETRGDGEEDGLFISDDEDI
jgi:HSP20 family molecular chaperone IbpA